MNVANARDRVRITLDSIRYRLSRITAQQIAFGAPAVAVVAISAFFTLRANATPAADPQRFSGSNVVMRLPSLLREARLPAGFTVAIVRDHEAASFYDNPSTLDTIIAVWRRALAPSGATVRVVRPSAIRSTNARVLVVPSSPCLSLDTRAAIDGAGERGQGLIVSGPTGTHDAGCRRIGYGLLLGLTNASRVEAIRERSMVYAAIPAGTPLSADLPPGARLNIAPAGQIALRVPARDVFYSDFTLGANPVDDAPYLDAAVVRGTYRDARVVYFGFELRDVADDAWHHDVLSVLTRNAVAWAAGTPIVALAPWPSGYRSAAVIAQDVEASFANARYALDSLEALGVRSTFFVTSNLAQDHRRLTRAMLDVGEVGTHSENHRLLGGTPFEAQLERLESTRRDLGELLENEVSGLRPPEEQFDEATMRAWLAAGGQYLLGANDTRCAAPELLGFSGDTLVLLPRAFADDFAAAGPEYRRAPHLVAGIMRADMRRAKDLHGLYVLSYHSQLLAKPEYVGVVAGLARELVADSSIWLATAGDVADWWRRRSLVEVQVVRTTDAYIDLRVRNRGDDVLKNVAVLVSLPRGSRLKSTANVSSANGLAQVTVPRIQRRSRLSIRVPIVR
ncbi:MAG: polysaccharide deacetylase family protein [Gemmatimonadaceae bacterium]